MGRRKWKILRKWSELDRGKEKNAFSDAEIKIKSFAHDITEFWLNPSLAQDVDCGCVTEGALLAHMVCRNSFWVANGNNNHTTRTANVHRPKSFFLCKLSSAVFQIYLLIQAQTSETFNPEAFLPKTGHERPWMLQQSPLFLLLVFKTCMSLAWPTLVIIRRMEKGAEGTNPRVWLMSTATLPNPTITYRLKLWYQQPPTHPSSSLFTVSGRLAWCTSPHCWPPGNTRRSWAHE